MEAQCTGCVEVHSCRLQVLLLVESEGVGLRLQSVCMASGTATSWFNIWSDAYVKVENTYTGCTSPGKHTNTCVAELTLQNEKNMCS
jgi:hypothetical protein